jgi:hypothetical protein
MANFTVTVTQIAVPPLNIGELGFISWSPYPQISNKKTEIVNRLGSEETITQLLFSSSMPIAGTAVNYLAGAAPKDIQAFNVLVNKINGLECKLVDSINNITIENLVVTDLVTRIKKVAGGWLLVAEFTQHIRK